jgi:hypothetical protein
MTPDQADEFVRAWLGPGDPTGLTMRGEILEKPQAFEPEEVEEPRELVLARETSDKE